jgi:ParB family transcriptional regulator, chromosome partitioning protein
MTEQAAAALPAFINRKVHLDKLRVSASNVRTVNAGTAKKPRMSHEQLVASINAVGLLSPLIVTEADDGIHEVHAGKGRYDALHALNKAGKLADPLIDVRVSVGGSDPVALSLIENLHRESMHPADECVAFKRLFDQGMGVDGIARMFAAKVRTVRQRLALASLHPNLLKLFKAGEMSLDVAEALTLEPDPKRQLAVWKRLEQTRRTHSASMVRDAITDQEVRSNDSLVEFVGLQTYIDHGGEFRENLFAEDDERILTDPALLESLAIEKLEVRAAELREQGWGEVRLSLEHPTDRWQMEKLQRPTKDEKAHAVYFVYPGSHGEVEAQGPYITKQAARAKDRARAQGGAGEGGALAVDDKVPETLMRSLTAHKSAAIQCALLGNPAVTMALLAAKLMASIQPGDYRTLPVHVSLQNKAHELASEARGYESTRAAGELALADQGWEGRIGESDKLAFFLAQDVSVSLEAIAYCTARSFSMMNSRDGSPYGVAELHKALGLNLADYFKPTAETYLSQVPKAKLMAAVTEAGDSQTAAALEKMKKGEAVQAAQAHLEGKGWVPEAIR